MNEPLALILFFRLLPGSQLVNRLQDLGYRVHACNDIAALKAAALSEGPMLILADLDAPMGDVSACILELRQDSRTSHIPVVAFSERPEQLSAAQAAGATVAVGDAAAISHLPAVLEQALRMD